ncbi:CAP family protein [Aetokthonos hydrillicola Thurmond2011]|jgi:uncharacterized protein YkwD|uniref:CAP family protein n=1 Tax=Aetokthonos hydrillicola Thurmond2011 TaxID=2712845 RepID=A0AAP5IFP8_9CYAN|nr:CAP family protein [Aetokthonos hydrillicola]MBO3459874.1 secretion protein [Aetokthonos hydrillicola CCALA 1050]MBW4583990.1 CAP family protein [Aetokthonos hydrillicola CCALA 1050]MDR9898813.1 CAP family protein [Aetokthonos hydrillicola Thurmond2011]
MITRANQKRFLEITVSCLATIVPLGMFSNGIALGQTADQLTKFRSEALNEHNAKRALHPINPLTLAPETDELNAGSQQWAEHLLELGKLQHSSSQERNGAGENLYVVYTTRSYEADQVAKQAVDRWYGEITNYDYNNPTFSSATGHFTQVVWKNTTTLGCGYAEGAKTVNGITYNAYYTVCRYSPAGNVLGEFEDNVLPPK